MIIIIIIIVIIIIIIIFLWKKNHYICIPAIDIDSVLKIDKKAYPQAYLEECKYKLKKKKLVSFIDSEIIDDDSDDDSYDSDNENDF